ncbi:MAG: hypothetical protein ABFD16_08945 [Thermoguttaceae bacterium]|jgi:hypothetical protein
MKIRLLVLAILVMIQPVWFGCGSSQPSYKDRVGKVDDSAPVEMPGPPDAKNVKKK